MFDFFADLDRPLHEFAEEEMPQWSTDGLACFIPKIKMVLRFDNSSDLLSKLEIASERSGFARMSPCGCILVSYEVSRFHCRLHTSSFEELTGPMGRSPLAGPLSNIAWHPCPPSGCCLYAVVLFPGVLILVDAYKDQDVAYSWLGDANLANLSTRNIISSCRLCWSSEGRRLCLVNETFATIFCFQADMGNLPWPANQ